MSLLRQYADKQGKYEYETFYAEGDHVVRLSRRIIPGQPVPERFEVARRKYSFAAPPPFENTDQSVDEATYRCLCAAKRLACQGRFWHGGYNFEQSLPLIEKAKEAAEAVEGYVDVVDIYLLMLQGLGLFKRPQLAYSRKYGEVKDANRLGVCFLQGEKS